MPSTVAARAWQSPTRLGALVILWLVVACGAFVFLWRYKSTPGARAAPAVQWPPQSAIPRATDRATLVMLAHPYCPCTKASVEELARLTSRTDVKVEAFVAFRAWDDLDPRESDLFQQVSKLPHVTAVVDRDGREAALFGAKTSGHVVVFDPAGKLLYSGGITGARGHAGDNAGADRVTSLLTKGTAESAVAPIFGCAIEGK